MRIPVINAPSVDSDPLRTPTIGIRSPGLGIAVGLSRVADEFDQVAKQQVRQRIELDVSENLAIGMEASSAALAEAQTKKMADVANDPAFVDTYMQRVQKGMADMVAAAKTPQAKRLLGIYGIREVSSARQTLETHRIRETDTYAQWSKGQAVNAVALSAAQAWDNDTKQVDSAADIAALVRSQMPNAKPSEQTAAIAAEVAKMHLGVFASIPGTDPAASQAYFDKYGAAIQAGAPEQWRKIKDALDQAVPVFQAEAMASQTFITHGTNLNAGLDAIKAETAGDKTTERYDEAVQRYTNKVKLKQAGDAIQTDQAGENGYTKMRLAGWNPNVFSPAEIAAMGASNHDRLMGIARQYRNDAEQRATTPGGWTPTKLAQFEAWQRFTYLANNAPEQLVAPRFIDDGTGGLVNTNAFVDTWAVALGPEYAEKAMKRFEEIRSDITNTGKYTAKSEDSTYEIMGVLERAGLIPFGEARSKWSEEQGRTYLAVEQYVNRAAADEQAAKPGAFKPNATFWQQKAQEAIRVVTGRGDYKQRPAYEYFPSELSDPNVVLPQDESAFRERYIQYRTRTVGAPPSDAQVRAAYRLWVDRGRPAMPEVPSRWAQREGSRGTEDPR